MAICPLCDRRRGTRACPALNAGICTRCCGTKRRRQVNCPRGCRFLQAAQAAEQESNPSFADLAQVRDMDPEFVNEIEHAINVVHTERFRDLKDREVKEALDNVFKTVQTEEKGLLYDYRSPDPRIQIMADAIARVIKRYREGENVSHKVDLLEVKSCLLAAVNAAKVTTRRNPDSTEYLTHIAQFAHPPEVAPEEKQVGRIIIP
jgi:hypothetical protein